MNQFLQGEIVYSRYFHQYLMQNKTSPFSVEVKLTGTKKIKLSFEESE